MSPAAVIDLLGSDPAGDVEAELAAVFEASPTDPLTTGATVISAPPFCCC